MPHVKPISKKAKVNSIKKRKPKKKIISKGKTPKTLPKY